MNLVALFPPSRDARTVYRRNAAKVIGRRMDKGVNPLWARNAVLEWYELTTFPSFWSIAFPANYWYLLLTISA